MDENTNQDTQTQSADNAADVMYGDGQKEEKQDDKKGLGSSVEEKDTKKEGEEKSTDEEKTDKKDSKEEKKESENELFGKPEQYDYKEVLPEGMELNQEMTTKFNEIASNLDLSQKGASELMSLAIELTQQTQQNIAEAYKQNLETKKADYAKSLKVDKELGGAKLNDTLKTATLAYNKFASDEIKDILAQTGLDNHPGVVRIFHELGKQMENDNIHSGNPVSEKKNHAQVMYPDM